LKAASSDISMTTPPDATEHYHVGGVLPADAPSYVHRAADKELYDGLQQRDFCYVFAPQDTGKSSLRQQTARRLQRIGYTCVAVDVRRISAQVTTADQWYARLTQSIALSLDLLPKLDLPQWWRDRQALFPVQRFFQFLDTLARPAVAGPLVLFIDQIEALLPLSVRLDDFFAEIRNRYQHPPDPAEISQLHIVLMGIITPAQLIRDEQRSPFPIGRAIPMAGFQFHECLPLSRGFGQTTGNPQALIREVLTWTQGQPLWTQRLCQLIHRSTEYVPAGAETDFVNTLVHNHLFGNWETAAELTHLQHISGRLLLGDSPRRLLSTYRNLLRHGHVVYDSANLDHQELLMSGIATQHTKGKPPQTLLTPANRLYTAIYNLPWVDSELNHLCPYHTALMDWVASKGSDETTLLTGEDLQRAIAWTAGKQLGRLEQQFFDACQRLDAAKSSIEEDIPQPYVRQFSTEATIIQSSYRGDRAEKTIIQAYIPRAADGEATILQAYSPLGTDATVLQSHPLPHAPSHSYQGKRSDDQVLYDHFLLWVEQESPEELLDRFRQLFINGRDYPDVSVAQALDRIIGAENAEREFKYILNRCCHILINRWQMMAGQQDAIIDLLQLFDNPGSSSQSSRFRSASQRRLSSLVQGFTHTEEYLTLQRLLRVLTGSQGRDNPPLGQMIIRYPYLYSHNLLSQNSSLEHQQTIRHIQFQRQNQLETDLTQYMTSLVGRAQIAAQTSQARASQLIQQAQNPTLLSDRELYLAIRQFVGTVHGTYTYRDLAQSFLSHIRDISSYGAFKDDLYEYLTSTIEPEYGKRQFNQKLYKQLQTIFPESESRQLDDFLLVRTCSQLFNFLVVDSPQQPSHYIFIDLISNLGPAQTMGLLLKIAMLSQKVKPHLERRFSILFNHYEAQTLNDILWFVKSLENMNIAFATNFSNLNLTSIRKNLR
jgi:hypothetical protein